MSNTSLLARAVLALVLLLGFYALALGVVGALVYIAYADIAHSKRIHPQAILGCIIGSVGILWAVAPRLDKFPAPGARFHEIRHIRLFRELNKIAEAVNQAMPSEVYLIPDMNAWVSHRGGFMGFGSRRAMGLGLPLLQTLTVSELRAVLAHEFGHFSGGEVALAPWIYKTRSAIDRTLQQLGGDILQYPFIWYCKMFLRITNSVSRRQEYAADALAARVVGGAPVIGGLEKLSGTAQAFDFYWREEVSPILAEGFRPPIAEGFAAFLESPDVRAGIAEDVEYEMQLPQSGPYDTHPCLKDRIAALSGFPAVVGPVDDRPAISLIDDISGLEFDMLQALFEENHPGDLRRILWEEALTSVHLPVWRREAFENIDAFEGIYFAELPELAGKKEDLSARFDFPDTVDRDAKWRATCIFFGAAILVILAERGHEITFAPGSPVLVKIGTERLRAFTILSGLASGEISAERWKELCSEEGLEQIRLDSALKEASGPAVQNPSSL